MKESITAVAAFVKIESTVPHWTSGISGSTFFVAEGVLWERRKDGKLYSTENGGEAYPYPDAHYISRKDIPESFARAACVVCEDFLWEYIPKKKCKTLEKAKMWAKVHNIREPDSRPGYLDD